MKFTAIERDRLFEILFCNYFAKKEDKILKTTAFWHTIKYLCEAYEIDSYAVQRAVQTLVQPENKPEELETYYLLNRLGVSVRSMLNMTGIYWQKQKNFEASIAKAGPPVIRSRITDPAMKQAMRTFIFACKDFFGCFRFMDYTLMDKFFKTT